MRKGVWRIDAKGADAVNGRVVWSPAKSLWNTAVFALALLLGPLYFDWSAVVVFLALSYITLLLGHSLGMHRRLIHKSFATSKWFERFLVWLGVLVGMAGPFGILRIHDLRDWAQREKTCHDFFAHRRGVWLDAFWQLHCRFEFLHPPRFTIEEEFALDRWYQWMERTWMLHQIPLGLALYWLGGMSWLVWGVPVRIAMSWPGIGWSPTLRITPAPARGSCAVPRCKPQTYLVGPFSPTASVGTTITTPFPNLPAWGSRLPNSTPVGSLYAHSSTSVWCGI
jgi:sn-1 stearoyl-lipid 9-desaturase